MLRKSSPDTVRVSVAPRRSTFSSLKQLLLSDIGGSENTTAPQEDKEDYTLAVSYQVHPLPSLICLSYTAQEFAAPPQLINWVDEDERDMKLTGSLQYCPSMVTDSSVETLKDKRINHLRRKYMFVRCLEFIMLFSYETLTEQALQLVNCVDVCACVASFSNIRLFKVCRFGRRVLEFPSLSCDSSAYQPLFGVAVFLLVYTLVFPGYLLYWLRKHRESLFDVDRLALWGIFYDHYHHRVYWWQVSPT